MSGSFEGASLLCFTSAKEAILNVEDKPRIFCCESTNVKDLADNQHVLCAGIDLNPLLKRRAKVLLSWLTI
ncbi:MAG: hypothetical protein ACI97K_002489 [Glaciecola sp.]